MDDEGRIGTADEAAGRRGEPIDLPAHEVGPEQDPEGKSEEQHVVGYLHRYDGL